MCVCVCVCVCDIDLKKDLERSLYRENLKQNATNGNKMFQNFSFSFHLITYMP